MFFTSDGGDTWQPQTGCRAEPEGVASLAMTSERVGWSLGASGTLCYTVTGGNTWIQGAEGARGNPSPSPPALRLPLHDPYNRPSNVVVP